MLVSVVRLCESAMCMHISLISWAPLPPHATIYVVSLFHPFSQGRVCRHLWCLSCTVTRCNFTKKSHLQEKNWLALYCHHRFSTWSSFCFQGPTSEIFKPSSELLHTFSYTCACVLSHFSRVWLFGTPWTVAHQAPLSMGFSRQEHWSGLPCPSPGDLPNIGIEPASPALAGGNSLPLNHQGSPIG